MKAFRSLLYFAPTALLLALLPGCVTILEDYRAEYSFAPMQVMLLQPALQSALAEEFGAANVTCESAGEGCTFRIGDPGAPADGEITVILLPKLPPLRPAPYFFLDLNHGRSAILVEKPGRELTDRVRRVHEAVRRVLDGQGIEWYFQIIIYQE